MTALCQQQILFSVFLAFYFVDRLSQGVHRKRVTFPGLHEQQINSAIYGGVGR